MTESRSHSLQSCIVMTSALCFHFFGYECARAASITMLAAKEVDFGNEALPLTIALGTPISGLILYLYTKSIKSNGSRITMRVSNIVCLVIMGIIAHFSSCVLRGFFGKSIIIIFYAFREIYVSLLSTQQWAFIATSLDKSTSGHIVTFSGIVSIASAVGGFAVEQLVKFGGVTSLLVSSCLCVLACLVLGEIAFYMRPHSCNMMFSSPVNDNSQKSGEETETSSISTHNTTNTNTKSEDNTSLKKKSNFMLDSWNLIWKHRILQLLLVEGVVHQLCTNMLNMMFLDGLRKEVAEDSVRAMLVGRFFASVNIVVFGLQIFVLPTVLSQASLPKVLTKVPLIVMCTAALGVIRPGIISVMLGFGVIKVLEYSVMTAASEMIYVDMGHEVRYLGKELIRYFGHKMGKSAASLVLSGLVAHYEPSLGTQSLWGAGLSLCWAYSMYQLANHLWERNRNEDGFGIFKTAASYSHLSGLDKEASSALQSKSNAVKSSRSVRLRKLSEDAALWMSKTSRRVTSKERSFSYSAAPSHNEKTQSVKKSRFTDDFFSKIPLDVPKGTRIADSVDTDLIGLNITTAVDAVENDDDLSSQKISEKSLSAEGTGPVDDNVEHASSWDCQLSFSSDENSSGGDKGRALLVEQEPLDSRSGERDGGDKLEGYGQEADAAWKQMYGGGEDEEDEDQDDNSNKSPFSNQGINSEARRRHSTSTSHSARTKSQEGQTQLDRSRTVSKRAQTMSFDGELEHSRPVMLRVGSMHVSLNTLEQVAISRTKRK